MSDKLKKIFHRDSFQAGDVVEWANREWFIIKLLFPKVLICKGNETAWTIAEDVKLIQPNVTLDDVLEKMFEVDKKRFTELDHDEYNYEDWLSDCYINEVQDILKMWQLKKSLWDQSESTQTAIEEILLKQLNVEI